jgi:hypothetical protein
MHYLFEITEEPNGLWKSWSVKKRKFALFTDCFTKEFPSLNLQARGEQGEEMANDGDLGLLDALPSYGVKPTWRFHKVKLRKLWLSSTLPASNSKKG